MQSGACIARELNAKAEAMGWGMRCYADLKFDHPELDAFAALWRERASAGVPSRALFDARSLKPFLRHVSIIERVCETPGHWLYRMRLYGSTLVQHMGEQTGRYLHEFIPADRLERWTLGYDAVLDGGEPLRFISRFEIPRLSCFDGESCSTPLLGKRGEVDTILAVTYFSVKEHLKVQSA